MTMNLEQQTENILRDKGWMVIPNAYYSDPNTSKVREKDIIATKTQLPDIDILRYEARLFIECKNFPTETEICAQQNIKNMESSLFSVNVPFAKMNEIEENKRTHFYEYNEIFSAMDTADHLNKAINQSIQSFAAFRASTSESGLYYILVVYSGSLMAVNQVGERQSRDSALVQVRALDNTFNLPNRRCLVEVVAISSLELLIDKIETDIKEINKSARFHHRMERNKIDENRRTRERENMYNPAE